MKSLISMLNIMLFSLSTSQVFAQDEGSHTSVQRLAVITAQLSHFPDESDKRELAQIMKNEELGDQVRSIAHALYNLKHAINNTDKKQLSLIINDKNTNNELRTLAKIVSNFNHSVSAENKALLQKMIDA